MLKKFKSESFVKLVSLSVGIFFLVGTFASLIVIRSLSADYSFAQFFPDRHPLLKQSQKVRQKFQLQERTSFFVVIEKTSGQWLSRQEIAKLGKLTEEINEHLSVLKAVSLATVVGPVENKNDISVGPIFENLPFKSWKPYIYNSHLLNGQLISEDYKSVLLVVEPKKLSPKNLGNLSTDVNVLIKKYFPDHIVQIGGSPAIQARFSQKLLSDVSVFLVLSLIVFGLIFAFLIRGRSSFILTFSSLIIINLAVMGLLAQFEIPFTVLLTSLPIIVSISLISLMIHTLHRWAEEVPHLKGMLLSERFDRSVEIIKEMFVPNFLGSLTTAIGFATLCLSDIPLIRQYGWVVASAIMFVWLCGQFILLGFMVYTMPALNPWTAGKSYWTLPVLKHSLPIVITVLLATIVLSFKGQDISFSSRLYDDLPKNEMVRKATETIDEEFGGTVLYDVVLESSKKEFWKDIANLVKVKEILNKLRTYDQIGSALSVTDLIDLGKIKNKKALAETLFLFTMSEENPLKNFLTEDAKSLRLALRLKDVPTNEITKLRSRVKKLIAKEFKSVQIKESGLGIVSHTINQEVSEDLVYSFWHSLVLIGLFLVFVFRSLRWALVACLPNLVPPMFLMGFMAIAGTQVKPGVALIFSIALGLAFNNTVYILSRLKKLVSVNRNQMGNKVLPIYETLLQEGNPCLFETVIMFSGFLIFVTSGFSANRLFGMYMILSIFAGALGDLFFMPALLKKFPQILGFKLIDSFNSNQTVPVHKAISVEVDDFKKVAAAVFVCFSIVFAGSRTSAADTDYKQVLEGVKKNVESKTDQAVVTMSIIEADGSKKARKLELKTYRKKNQFFALAKMMSPADVKGMGLLSEVKNGKESQWLYLPSSKQVRRVVNPNKSSGVLGSELTIEDLNSAAIKGASVKFFKKDGTKTVLEIVPKKGTSVYNKVLSSISSNQLPQRTEYYINNKLFKSVEFLNYKQFGSVFRAQQIKVKNYKNKRGTDLDFQEIKVNADLSEDDFTVQSLKD